MKPVVFCAFFCAQLLYAGCSPNVPSDAELQHSFDENWEVLDQILAHVANNDGVVSLEPEGVTLKDRRKVATDDLESSRLGLKNVWLVICRELQGRQIESAYLWPEEQTIEVIQCSYGNVSGGFAYGFLYAEHPRGKILNSLDDAPERRGRYLAPTNRKHWYLFLRIDG